MDSGSGKKRKHSAKEEVNDKIESLQTEDQDDDSTTVGAKSDPEEINSEDETEERQDEPESSEAIDNCSPKKSAKKDTGSKTGEKSKSVSKGSSANASGTPDKSTKKPSGSKSNKDVAEAESGSKQKMPLHVSKKQQFEKKSDGTTPAKDKSLSKKNSTKSSTKDVEKDQGYFYIFIYKAIFLMLLKYREKKLFTDAGFVFSVQTQGLLLLILMGQLKINCMLPMIQIIEKTAQVLMRSLI